MDAGIIEQHEHQMVRNVFYLDDRSLASMMLPREDIVWMDAALGVREALALASANDGGKSHSWYPVCKGSPDQVVGVISVARLLADGA